MRIVFRSFRSLDEYGSLIIFSSLRSFDEYGSLIIFSSFKSFEEYGSLVIFSSLRPRHGATGWGHRWGLAVGKICLEARHRCLATYVACNRYLWRIFLHNMILSSLAMGPHLGTDFKITKLTVGGPHDYNSPRHQTRDHQDGPNHQSMSKPGNRTRYHSHRATLFLRDGQDLLRTARAPGCGSQPRCRIR